jgi:hypothetical protein
LAEIDDLLEEALEDLDTQTLVNAGQAGVIRELLVQRVAEIPAMSQVEAGRLDELALGADPLEEHDQLQLEEDHRIDAGAAALGIEIRGPFTDESQVELRLKMTVEVGPGNEGLQRGSDQFVEAAEFGWAGHRRAPAPRLGTALAAGVMIVASLVATAAW